MIFRKLYRNFPPYMKSTSPLRSCGWLQDVNENSGRKARTCTRTKLMPATPTNERASHAALAAKEAVEMTVATASNADEVHRII